MFDRIVRFFGSIKLAIPLLSAIVGILIWATFYESQVGSTTVQQEIYKSPWFGALMFMLAMNLGISALSRYPWRGARKIGFAITHLGLIVIIAGSAAVIHLGVEGMLLVRTDSGANNQIRVEGDTLEVLDADNEIVRANIFIKEDGRVNPRFVGDLELEAYSDNTVKVANFVPGGGIENPAIKLSLHSDRMGQTLERSLAVAPSGYDTFAVGPAELGIVRAKDSTELKQLLTAPQEDNQHPWGEITINYNQGIKSFDVKDNREQSVKFKDLELKIFKFFPDFRLDANNRPINASDNLNNPGVLLEITNSTGLERWFIFGKEEIPPIHAVVSGEAIADLDLNYQVQLSQANDYFRVIVAEDGEIYYAAKSSKGFKSGKYEVGQSVTPGWADFQITLEEYIPKAKLQRDIVVSNDPNVEGSPALLVKTPSGKETWLPWAEPTVIGDENGEIYAAFSPKLLQIPFAVKLEDFIVDRNEGSESVAMWTSKIRIEDEANNVVEPRKVWMNHPTWYQGWKIAQASWNPEDLRQSTLQVKREPALVTGLTWLGSVLVVSGIAVIFYAPALTKKFRRKKQQDSPSETLSSDKADNQELAATP
ncbi:MAG: cytochrome c biogenesis protein ResB [Xenococcaceae cyanobacterium MO_167.B27]|nr:cytochrome c biogenesis protein ResB [Xenococcaceae cyanobacterium MO_167.B27]